VVLTERSIFMNSNLLSRAGFSLAAVSGVVLAACLVTLPAHADSWDKMTLLTVSEPTQVSDTYLEPGTYMLKLANSDRHIVQIFNKDRSHLINTIIAIPDYRLNVTDKSQFTFWETPPGTAKAVRAWFYPGDNDGQEFRYPTNLRQIAAVTAPQPRLVEPPPVTTQPQAAEPEPPAPAPAPQAFVQPAPEPQPPVEIAQNNPPPAPPAPIAAPAPPPDQPQALPSTASPYPMIGLGGLLSLGLYLGLRAKQLS
jgi:hypothetical protein